MIKYLSKFFYVLSVGKQKFSLLLFCFIISSLLDALGIGLIGPFLGLVNNENLIRENVFLQLFFNQIGIFNAREFVALIGLLIIITFFVKTLLYLSIQKYVFEFSFTQQSRLRLRLLNNYIKLPYEFHLQKNSAVLIQNVTHETQNFCYGVLIPILGLIANSIVVSVLLIVLAATDFNLTLAVLGTVIIAFVPFFKFRNSIARWGKQGGEANIEMIRIINHSIGGLKETKVIGCNSYFENKLADEARKCAQLTSKFQLFQILPRISLELFLIVCVIGTISLSLLSTKQNPQNLISTLGVFAVASIRLMPSASQVISAVGGLRNSAHTVDRLYLDLKELENMQVVDEKSKVSSSLISKSLSKHQGFNTDVMPFTQEIVLDNINYRYPGNAKLALNSVSLTLKKGQSIALIGKSGAGKTTLVDVILGLLMPEHGDIKVDGISVYSNLRAWQNLIGYIPQSIFLMDDTIERNIAFGVLDEDIDLQRLEKAIEAAQLTELLEQLPDGFKTAIGERGVRLSGGQRQRIGIARALYHEREILILDEATAALDNETESLVTEAIRSLSRVKTMIIIAHRLTTIEHCDCIYVMAHGQVVKSGNYQEVVLEDSMLYK